MRLGCCTRVAAAKCCSHCAFGAGSNHVGPKLPELRVRAGLRWPQQLWFLGKLSQDFVADVQVWTPKRCKWVQLGWGLHKPTLHLLSPRAVSWGLCPANEGNELATATDVRKASFCGFEAVHAGYRDELRRPFECTYPLGSQGFAVVLRSRMIKDLWPLMQSKIAKCRPPHARCFKATFRLAYTGRVETRPPRARSALILSTHPWRQRRWTHNLLAGFIQGDARGK